MSKEIHRGKYNKFDSLCIKTNVQYSTDMISQFIYDKGEKCIQVELAQSLQCIFPFVQLPFFKVLNHLDFMSLQRQDVMFTSY